MRFLNADAYSRMMIILRKQKKDEAEPTGMER